MDTDSSAAWQRCSVAHRAAIAAAWRPPEHQCIAPLLAAASLPPVREEEVAALARRLALGLRRSRGGMPGIAALMREYSLSSREGVALMCLAESLLRIPDAASVDLLIRDKLALGEWDEHIHGDGSLFLNGVAWSLLISGKLLAPAESGELATTLRRLLARAGEPLIRAAMQGAMRLLGEQFVCGETIERALGNAESAERLGYRHSFDMLGEAALGDGEARAYLLAYEQAVAAIGAAHRGQGPRRGGGISIKLSALHPRFEFSQRDRVFAELLPRLRSLASLARHHDIGLCIDAEEAERLDLTLELFEALACDQALAGWGGLGIAVQAYQKRAPAVIDFLLDLARGRERPLMVRLVKGAYWDQEIKRAQQDGLAHYPVFTRKAHTDICYLSCAAKLLARRDLVYPQFASHNARTVASVYQLAGDAGIGNEYEFQCLYGMGRELYDQVIGAGGLDRPCRIYAPVGSHRTLLPYLVRRLLENGANNSFINRSGDAGVSVDELIADPAREARADGGASHPRVRPPPELFGDARRNSAGRDLADERQRELLAEALAVSRHAMVAAVPWPARSGGRGARTMIRNPADHGDVVGSVVWADAADVEAALASADAAAAAWAATAPRQRAALLERAADLIEASAAALIALCVREAGKTLASSVAEVREATDYCRYYAAEINSGFDNASQRPLGTVVCISPWNFPLAIFVGQVAAALAAGNAVLAKPAEQTPLIAFLAVQLLHRAGIPQGALQYLPGDGEGVGAALVAGRRVGGVLFTGSSAVAREIQARLAERGDVALIAETGGQNCMIVDSTAVPEQVVADVLRSAFDSAGQRCSSLRVLCLQEDIAGHVLALLKGAMAELRVGNPACVGSDLGPIIDAEAARTIRAHIEGMRGGGRVFQAPLPNGLPDGEFIAPTLIEIDTLSQLGAEVFGPVLHVLRFARDRLDDLLADIHATGYGLTLGIHSRIDAQVAAIVRRARVGNIYVNRNMIGAVVGVQPFGGEGLSGTGPKAGGPLYLHRLLAVTPAPALSARREPAPGLALLAEWLGGDGAKRWLTAAEIEVLLNRWNDYARQLPPHEVRLPGPVGEENTLRFVPRGCVFGEASSMAATLDLIATAVASGNRLLLGEQPQVAQLLRGLPPPVSECVAFADAAAAEFSAWLLDADLAADSTLLTARLRMLAARSGPIVPLLVGRPGYDLTRLFVERAVCVNTAAIGGVTQLLGANPD